MSDQIDLADLCRCLMQDNIKTGSIYLVASECLRLMKENEAMRGVVEEARGCIGYVGKNPEAFRLQQAISQLEGAK